MGPHPVRFLRDIMGTQGTLWDGRAKGRDNGRGHVANPKNGIRLQAEGTLRSERSNLSVPRKDPQLSNPERRCQVP